MSKKLYRLLSDESFQRWLSNNASQNEINEWNDWLKQTPNNKELYDEALELWNAAEFQPKEQPDVETEWLRLKNSIQSNQKPQKVFTLGTDYIYQRHSRANLSLRFIVVSLTSLILVGFVYLFFLHEIIQQDDDIKYQNITTDYGQRATLKFPDGTNIVLNANSTLSYPAEWNDQTPRKLYLKGEAYFDVTKRSEDIQKRFIVYTADGEVSVLGTKFVVYDRDKGTSVILEEGNVEFSTSNDSINKPEHIQKIFLRPGQLLHFRKKNDELTLKNINIIPYTTWWKKEIIFDKTSFKDIVTRIKETYGVEVIVNDKSLLERTFSGTIENRNLIVLTEALAYVLKVDVHRKGQTIIFGT